MSRALTNVQIGLALLAPCLQAGLIALMWRRRIQREYAAFFVYTIWQIVRAIILNSLLYFSGTGATWYAAYFYAYWTAELCSTVLAIAVVRSVFIAATHGYRITRNWGGTLFLIALATLLAVAIWAAYSAPVNSSSPIIRSVLILDRSVLVLQTGLLLILLLFSTVLGISLKQKLFGIALGFGIYATVHLVPAAIRTHGGAIYDWLFQISKSAAYNIAVIIWLVYLCAPQRETVVAQLPGTDVKEWNESLLEVLK